MQVNLTYKGVDLTVDFERDTPLIIVGDQDVSELLGPLVRYNIIQKAFYILRDAA